MLESICSKTSQEIIKLENSIKTNNLEALKEKSIEYVQTFVQVTEKLLEGSIFGDPDKFGQTLSEERLDCSLDLNIIFFAIVFLIRISNYYTYLSI
jgi:hypothetical protein